MGISLPGDLHIGVSQPPSDLLNVDPLIGEQACMAVSVIMYAQRWQLRQPCPLRIVVRYRCITQAFGSKAHAIPFTPFLRVLELLEELVLCQKAQQRLWELHIPNRRFVFRGRFHNTFPLHLLADTPAHMEYISLNVRPFQSVDLPFSQTSVVE